MSVERIDLAPGLSISRVAHRPLADRRHGARRPHARPRAHRARRCSPYVDAGLTTFDMADHYGSAEVVAGRLPRERRRRPAVQLLHEVGAQAGAGDARRRPRGGRRARCSACASSRSTCCSSTPGTTPIRAGSTTLFHLQELKREGLIRHLGLTNVDTAHLQLVAARAASRSSRTRCRSRCSISARPARWRPFCAEHGVQLLAYGTLAGGWLTERWLGAARARLGAHRHLVADEVRPLHPRRRRLGGAAARAAAAAARGAAARRLDRQRRQPLHPRAARRRPASSSAPGSASASTSTTTLRLFAFALTDEDRARARGGARHAARRFPATAATSTASRRSSPRPATSAITSTRSRRRTQVQRRADGRTLCLSGTPWERSPASRARCAHGQRITSRARPRRSATARIGGTRRRRAGALRHRQDRRRAAVARRAARRRRPHARLRAHIGDWEAVARATASASDTSSRPTRWSARRSSGDEYLVEIEAEAEIGSAERSDRQLARPGPAAAAPARPGRYCAVMFGRALAQHVLLDLAGRGLRQLVDEREAVRHLEVRQVLAAELRAARPRWPTAPGLQHDERVRRLAPLLVRHARRPRPPARPGGAAARLRPRPTRCSRRR